MNKKAKANKLEQQLYIFGEVCIHNTEKSRYYSCHHIPYTYAMYMHAYIYRKEKRKYETDVIRKIL